MTRVYVSLDLETTGLDPRYDRIIEVGVVRFKGDRVLDEYHTLVNPGCAIPYQIEQLTGISNKDVAGAPRFESVQAPLLRFVGENPIVGHNIKFDLSFLAEYGLFEASESIDTFEMAGILLPHAERYSLSVLAKMVGIQDTPTHRALDDARVTHQFFEAMLDQARRLDADLIAEVAEMASRSRWSLAPVFKDLARERRNFIPSLLGQQLSSHKRLTADELAPPLTPLSPPQRLDIDDLAALIKPGGAIERAFPNFEHRLQQVSMLEAVADAFNERYHLMVEAGTGTGKSMAYLLPAIQWAIQNNARVVISTNTINLQDQILTKDLPNIKKAINVDFKAVALKGRSNYVCASRVEQMRKKPSLSPTELRLLAKIMVWLPNTTTGDKQELFMPDYAEQALWNQVNANADICPPDKCNREGCFFARARQAAESAHLIVVNHALLLADIAVNNRAIPDYRYLIIDEAHHLEDNITEQLSFAADEQSLQSLLTDLAQTKSGLFADMAQRVKQAGLNQQQDFNKLAEEGRVCAQKAGQAVQMLFKGLNRFMAEFTDQPKNQYDRKLRISAQLRMQPAWSDVEIAWDNAGVLMADLLKRFTQASKLWDALDSYDVQNWDEVMALLVGYRQQIEMFKQQLNLIITEGDEKTITWMEQKVQTEDISLHAAPLHVGDLVRQHLLSRKDAVIFTSATMRTDNSFEYIKERLGAWDVQEIAVGSPFDYEHSTLVYIPTNLPEPGAPGYQKVFEDALINLATATQGRMLVLFTSYTHLRTTAQNISGTLGKRDIVVYQQGSGAGRRQLLDNFKNADRAVLMGTRSFWEGIDVPGSALSCVVIAKIPFGVPSDPIFQARSETFDDAFAQYSVPEAILHFRQGFGRLIRTRSDRGVVVVMDKRVLTKNYGRFFLDSLPEATVKQGLTTDLPKIAGEWINAV